ncbi:Small, acid-soluble spore protein, alpha/beta type [Desulfotomaculum arcticum]|uniref:Small, acid-soluble spore protein, alpha/beta type n=1 Tax=Desulfotruncus arcticus DSM 17038 TaxID=1121424 RepID=A0A1I2RHE5_9FIRM|nr:alpha/beta-type small acid-soluble spore protein [Desulfotruncus arcticus]SFG38919.1 Small, acid-soluble spore protein, alpha/beta type [Desulfotomaculum arcticum] [Desulfotruncus arcticus DSM 17038]
MAQGQRTNRKVIPAASAAMDSFKWETASELGVQVPQGGYMGDLPSRVNGAIGGNMVKKMIAAYEQSLAQGNKPPTPQVTNQTTTP